MDDAEAGKGYIGYYDGGAFGIPTLSKNKEAALLFLQYHRPGIGAGRLGGRRARASSRRLPMTIRRSRQWIRRSTAITPYERRRVSSSPAHRLIRSMHRCVRRRLRSFWQAITGELSASDALDQMAAAAEQELKNLGYRK